MKHYDVLIIGAGTAGLSAAKEVAKHTDKFAIVESGPAGTLCARTGCMPSKTLIAAAKAYHQRHKYDVFGIQGVDNVFVNIPDTLKHVRTLRDYFVESVNESMQKYKIITGTARLVKHNIVEVANERIQAGAILICTGSTPRIPDIFSEVRKDILTTDTIFEQDDLPKRLAIIGTGNVGTEMGQALSRLGCSISLFGRSSRIAGITDPEIYAEAENLLSRDLHLHLNTSIERDTKSEKGVSLHHIDGQVCVDKVFICAGRKPNLDGLGLDLLDIELDENGVPIFDPETLQIQGLPIYLAGDSNSHRAILHEAADEGKIAARHALGFTEILHRRVPLHITFTDPPIVQVGLSYEEAMNCYSFIGEVSYSTQGRALIEQENFGKLRLYSRRDGVILGAELVAPGADHMGHLLALAIKEKIPVRSLLEMPIYHPVLEEGLRSALVSINKQINNSGLK